MQALIYHGPGQKQWESKSDPKIEDPTDAIVRIDVLLPRLHTHKDQIPRMAVRGTLGCTAGLDVIPKVTCRSAGSNRGNPDLACQSPLVPGGSARTCRPRGGHGWLEYPLGRPRPEFGYAPTWRRGFPGYLHRPRQCAGRGDRVAGVCPAPSTSRKERSERQPHYRTDLGFVAPTAVVDG